MSLTALQNSGIIERLEEMAAREERSSAHATGHGFPPPWGQDIIDAHLERAKTIREAVALLRASREALGGLFGELMNPDVVIARIPLSDEPLDRAAAVMKALDDGGEAVHTGRLWDEP